MMNFPVYMYHQVAPQDSPGFEPELFVTPDILRRQIRSLLAWGYELVTMDEAVRRCSAVGQVARSLSDPFFSPPRRIAVLTFDDLYLNFYEYAWPVLAECGAVATAFAIGHLQGSMAAPAAGGVANVVAGYGKPADNAKLRELAAAGIEIGAHSQSHREMTGLSASELREETAGCKAVLEDLLGCAVPSFCYPRGRFSARVEAAVAQAGFHAACTTLRGNCHEHPLRLRRIKATGSRVGASLWYTTTRFYDWRYRRRAERELAAYEKEDRERLVRADEATGIGGATRDA